MPPQRSENYVTKHALVGRDPHLASLRQLETELRQKKQPKSIFITGKSGEGKTALAESFLSPIRDAGESVILSGRCYDRETMPFKVIDCLVDALVAYLITRDDDEVTQLLPDDMQMLVSLFPVLGRLSVVETLPAIDLSRLDAKQIRQRAFAAFREIILRIAKQAPTILFVDDLQWGDAASAEVLRDLLFEDHSALLVLGTYRIDDGEDSPFLGEWRTKRTQTDSSGFQPDLTVGPLTQEQCAQMLVSKLGMHESDTLRNAKKLFESTGGNPYFVEQLIECMDPKTGTFTPAELTEIIGRRLNRLPSSAISMLDIIAVSGKALAIDEVIKAAGQNDSDYPTLTHMRSEKLVRLVGPEPQGLVDTYHDKIRETVLGGLDLKSRQSMHLSLGETIEAKDNVSGTRVLDEFRQGVSVSRHPGARVFDLAFHFDAAKQKEKALAYSIMAAERAQKQFALDLADKHYSVAQKYSDDETEAVRYRVAAGSGQTLLSIGRYNEADDKLKMAARLSTTRDQSIDVKSLRAEIVYKTESVIHSIETYDDLLSELGIKTPKSAITKLIGIVQISFWNRMQKNGVASRLSRIKNPPSSRESLAMKVLCQFAIPCWFRDPLRGLWAISKAQQLALKFNDLTVLALASGLKGMAIAWYTGREKRARHHLNISAEIAKQLDNTALEAHADYFRAAGIGNLGYFREGIDCVTRSLEKYRQINDAWRITYSLFIKSTMHSGLGNISESVSNAQSCFEWAIRLGQGRLAQKILGRGWAIATNGNLPFEELSACFEPVEDDFASSIEYLVGKSVWHRCRGQTEESLFAAERAMDVFKEYWPIVSFVSVAYPNYANALRIHALAIKDQDPRQSGALMKRARRAAWKAIWIQRFTPCHMTYALREYSLVLAEFNKLQKALRYAEKACDVAERNGAKWEYARSQLVVGQLRKAIGFPGADDLIHKAKTQLAEFESETESLAEIKRPS